jgi:LPXTG-site transpeptidase (sortase) family protein
MVLGLSLMAMAAVGVGYPLWWNHQSSVGGQRLLRETLETSPGGSTRVARGGDVRTIADCKPFLPSQQSETPHLVGVLDIAGLGVKAPVLQGLTDSVFNVAVGHDPLSPWPGTTGESVLEAHDVSYFAHISSLRTGDEVTWVTGCNETTFRVVSTEVTTPGVVLNPPAGGIGLALITCYPTDALFWTPDRYVVELSYVTSSRVTSGPVVGTEDLPALVVPAPASLVAEGLTLRTNFPLLGSLQFSGHPSLGFVQGPAPLAVESLALEDYFATQKAIDAGDPGWWRAISVSGLALPAPWSTGAALYVTIDVNGSSVVGATVYSSYVTMQLTVHGHDLLIASVSAG